MNDMSFAPSEATPASAFEFTGTWREYAPIAITNLLLTVVTLGIYRFWAQARTRRYLWSRTRFIDDRLEWTGTGKEMFLGFLVVLAVFIPAALLFQFGVQALVLRGAEGAAFAVALLLYLGLFYFIGVARFRAIRYRLSRTWWHGIRGGSEDGGWGYGVSAIWKPIVGTLAAGLMVPWSMTSLWNERWGKMSFGPHRVHTWADTDGLMLRWIALLVTPIALVILGSVAAVSTGAIDPTGRPSPGAVVTAFLAVLGFYVLIALIGLGYFAAFLRKVIGSTAMGGLEFGFTARSMDWLKLFLGNLGLAVVTLGIGIIFWPYRNWSFFIRHMEAYGAIDLDSLTQSEVAQRGDAEGLASMFDVGAI